jgi:hypothetical protein
MTENAKIQDLTPKIEEDEINLLDYWRVIWKRRKLIGRVIVPDGRDLAADDQHLPV